MRTYLVTGAAGFIGTNFVKYLLKKYDRKNVNIIALDKLTYAANIENLRNEIENKEIIFEKVDILDERGLRDIFKKYDIDYVVNFAAESHVDRSIENPRIFLETNVLGVQNLLEVAKENWSYGKDENLYLLYKKNKKFLQVSTDEVYGSLTIDYPDGKELNFKNKVLDDLVSHRKDKLTYGNKFFEENTPLSPKSPYSSSKAAADMLVLAYKSTYHMPINITRCSNNYGPYQFEEKLIPLMIKNILKDKKLPIYGEGKNVRDWLYVEDHCKAIDLVLREGKLGEIYNVGGFNEKRNIDIVNLILKQIAKMKNERMKKELISYVSDRLGHDARYAINPEKIVQELSWFPQTEFEDGILKTIEFYIKNNDFNISDLKN